MTQPTKPAYIERGGEQSWPPPYDIRGVRFYAFLLEANYAALEAYIDRVLNEPAGGAVRYKPLASRVMLGLMGAEKVLVGPRGAPRFYIPERDLAFWVPVACVKRELGVDVISRIAFYLSYVQVDDGWAVTSGRENYGYPKELAQFVEETTEAPGSGSRGFLTRLESHVLAVEQFGPDSLAAYQKLIEIRRSAGAPEGPVTRALESVEEVARELYSVLVGGDRLTLPGLGLVAEVADLFEHHQYPLVFLKEFRDIADGTLSCYRSVIESPVHITAFRHAALLDGKYDIAIGTYASHPIVQDLGLVSHSPPVLAAGYMDFDFYVDGGKEIGPA